MEWKHRGRIVTPDEIHFIQRLIDSNPQASRRQLSAKLCEAWQWKQANGALRDMVCRGLLLMLHRAGQIQLPPIKKRPNNPSDRDIVLFFFTHSFRSLRRKHFAAQITAQLLQLVNRGLEILRERVRAGLAHARKDGQRLGRPPSASLHAKRVRQLFRTGTSKAEIARQLKIGRISVRRILRSK